MRWNSLSCTACFDQAGDFAVIGKSLSFNLLLGEDQFAVAPHVKDTAASFYQCNV
jgi:hypothetical protein